MPRPALVLASHNKKKLGELRAIVSGLGLDPGRIVGAGEVGLPEPIEDGVSFEANALIKARAGARACGLPVLADDSGLCVDVLGGAPGIFSARWCGRHGDDGANNSLLLAQLETVPDEHRGARFVCAVALVVPGEVTGGEAREYTARGEMRGRLLRQPSGGGGFGYDPLFVADSQSLTNAQLAPEVKNTLSHRTKALAALFSGLGDTSRLWN